MIKSNDFLNECKILLIEAGETFNRPPNLVNLEQLRAIARGRLSVSKIRIFGFDNIKNCLFPNDKTSKSEQKAMKALVAKLLK